MEPNKDAVKELWLKTMRDVEKRNALDKVPTIIAKTSQEKEVAFRQRTALSRRCYSLGCPWK